MNADKKDRIMKRCGGYWGNHKMFNVESWQYLVRNGDTRVGYWDFVFANIEERERQIKQDGGKRR